MPATLLQIVYDACGEIGLVQPSVVAASSDSNIVRLLTMLNREGRELARSNDWTVLIRTHSFSTVADQSEYALPSDYDHLIRDTEWDRTNFQPMQGPLTPQDWEAIQSGSIGNAGPYRRYRLVRSASAASKKIVVDPAPPDTGDELAFQYVSGAWCTAANGTTLQTAMAVDTDLALLHQDLLTLGTIIRFKRSVGLDYGSEADEYASMLGREIARDRPSRTLDMAGQGSFRLISSANMPIGTIGS
jgi:hypothetical protein